MKGFSKTDPPGHKGVTDVWLTPLELISNLNSDFDLDPCGEADHQTAKTIYTENGLEQKWFGNVWLNPPYSEVGQWLKKLSEHGMGTALVFARTDTRWAQEYMPKAETIFFLKGRIKFLTRDKKTVSNAGAPSMFLTFGYMGDFSNFDGFLV